MNGAMRGFVWRGLGVFVKVSGVVRDGDDGQRFWRLNKRDGGIGNGVWVVYIRVWGSMSRVSKRHGVL